MAPISRRTRPGATSAIARPTPPPPPEPVGLPRLAMMFGVYLQVSFALIFFRSDSLRAAFALLHDMTGSHGFGHLGNFAEGALAFALFPVVWFLPNTQQILGQETTRDGAIISAAAIGNQPAPTLLSHLRWAPTMPWAIALAVLFFAVLANLDSTSSFLYFQF